jgi:hypothetical protein
VRYRTDCFRDGGGSCECRTHRVGDTGALTSKKLAIRKNTAQDADTRESMMPEPCLNHDAPPPSNF